MEEASRGDRVDCSELPLRVVMQLVDAGVNFYLFKLAPFESNGLFGVFLALNFMLLINS